MSVYNKIKSVDIKVFPTAYRGQKSDTLSYNPEARLNSEFNLTHLALRGGSKDAFVVEEKSNEITFSIHGYLFTLYNTQGSIDILKTQFTSSSEIWAYIKVEALNNPSYDGTNYEAFTLTSFKPSTRGGESKIPLDDEGIFYGINFVSSKAEIDADTSASTKYPLKLYEKVAGEWKVPASSKLNITTNEIEDGNNGKPISEQLTTNMIYGNLSGNATTATAFESAATISLTGDISGSATSNHSWDITTTIGTSKVLTSMISDANITTAKIKNGAVTAAKMQYPWLVFQNGSNPFATAQQTQASVNTNTIYPLWSIFKFPSSITETQLVKYTSATNGNTYFDLVTDEDFNTVIPNGYMKSNKHYISGNFPRASIIGAEAFADCTSLSTFKASNVNYIEGNAFKNCSSLSVLEIPKTLEIGYSAFAGCTTLTSISLSSITYIADSAFEDDEALKKAYIPLVSYVGNSAFQNCTSLSDVTLSQISYIGSYAFARCSSLTGTNIKWSSCTYFGDYAFADCTSLNISYFGASYYGLNAFTSVPYSSTSLTFNTKSFYDQIQIKNLTFNASNLNTIYFNTASAALCFETDCFDQLSNLQTLSATNSLVTPSRVTLKSCAFRRCYNLQSISQTLLSNVDFIGQEAFSDCSSLTSIYLSLSSTFSQSSINAYSVFTNCNSLEYFTIITNKENSEDWPTLDNHDTYPTGLNFQPSTLIGVSLNGFARVSTTLFNQASNITSLDLTNVALVRGTPYSSWGLINLQNSAFGSEFILPNGRATDYWLSSPWIQKITLGYSGTDNIEVSRVICPSLTTVAFPNASMLLSQGRFYDFQYNSGQSGLSSSTVQNVLLPNLKVLRALTSWSYNYNHYSTYTASQLKNLSMPKAQILEGNIFNNRDLSDTSVDWTFPECIYFGGNRGGYSSTYVTWESTIILPTAFQFYSSPYVTLRLPKIRELYATGTCASIEIGSSIERFTGGNFSIPTSKLANCSYLNISTNESSVAFPKAVYLNLSGTSLTSVTLNSSNLLSYRGPILFSNATNKVVNLFLTQHAAAASNNTSSFSFPYLMQLSEATCFSTLANFASFSALLLQPRSNYGPRTISGMICPVNGSYYSALQTITLGGLRASISNTVLSSVYLYQTYFTDSNYPLLGSNANPNVKIYVPAAYYTSAVSAWKSVSSSFFSSRIYSIPATSYASIILTQQYFGSTVETFTASTGIKYVGLSAFFNCHSLSTVNLPQTLAIGQDAFNTCESLTTISAPKCEVIGKAAFAGCGFTSVYFPELVYIGKAAFAGCSFLSKVRIPKAKYIEDWAFVFSRSYSSYQYNYNLSYSWPSSGLKVILQEIPCYLGLAVSKVKFYLNNTQSVAPYTIACRSNLYIPNSMLSQYQDAYPHLSFNTFSDGDIE